MLIIDGADTTGKSTLAYACVKLLNERGWPHVYQHLSRLPECWRQDPLCNYTRLASRNSVWDRFHISDPPYARIRNDAPVLTMIAYTQLSLKLSMDFDAFVVVVLASDDLIRKRYEAKREMYDLELVLRVNALFRDIIETGGLDGYQTKTNVVVVECTDAEQEARVIVDAYVKQRQTKYPGAT